MSRFDFNLDAPSGNLVRDLESGKRVELRRGQNTRVEKAGSDERVIRFVCSTDGVKRDGNRLRNDGWDLESFSKNPVMLWSHDYSQPPVGSWQDWKVVKDGEDSSLVMTAKFADYDFADTVYKLYLDGHMRAVSIGWTPLEYDKIEDDDGNFVGFDFLKNELLECSAVPIPADPDALMEATARGLISGDKMERFAQVVRVGDITRGEAYVLDHRGLRQEERVAIVFNDKAVDWAKGAIENGNYDASAEWSFSEDDANALLGEEDWEGYASYFLGRDEDHTEDSHEGWMFPIAKVNEEGEVALYASALEAAIEGSEDEAIAAAAADLLSELRAVEGEVEEEEEVGVEEVVEEPEVEEEPEAVVEASAERDDSHDLNRLYDSLVAHVKGANLPLMDLWKSIKAHADGDGEAAMDVAENAHRVATMLSAGIDIAASIAEHAGGEDTTGEGAGGESPGDEVEEVVEEVVEASADDAFSQGLERLLEAMDSWSPAPAGSATVEDPADEAFSEEDLSMLARVLGEVTKSGWIEGVREDAEAAEGEERIGKKVSRKRAEKIAEASRCAMNAYKVLEEVLEDIGNGELLTEEEATDGTYEDEEDSREATPEETRTQAEDTAGPECQEDGGAKIESRERSLEERIDALTRSLDAEDESIAKAKVDKALRSLAERLDIDIDTNYVDEIL